MTRTGKKRCTFHYAFFTIISNEIGREMKMGGIQEERRNVEFHSSDMIKMGGMKIMRMGMTSFCTSTE